MTIPVTIYTYQSLPDELLQKVYFYLPLSKAMDCKQLNKHHRRIIEGLLANPSWVINSFVSSTAKLRFKFMNYYGASKAYSELKTKCATFANQVAPNEWYCYALMTEDLKSVNPQYFLSSLLDQNYKLLPSIAKTTLEDVRNVLRAIGDPKKMIVVIDEIIRDSTLRPFIKLAGLDLCATKLKSLNIQYADLRYIHLQNIKLNVLFVGNHMAGSILTNLTLIGGTLSQCNLHLSNLDNSNLTCANISDSDISGSSFKNIKLFGITFFNKSDFFNRDNFVDSLQTWLAQLAQHSERADLIKAFLANLLDIFMELISKHKFPLSDVRELVKLVTSHPCILQANEAGTIKSLKNLRI